MSSLYDEPKFRMMGETGLLVEYGAEIDLSISRKVQAVRHALFEDIPIGVVEIIPAYCSLLIVYDPLTIGDEELKRSVCEVGGRLSRIKMPEPETVEVPVCYGGRFGPDLAHVASHNGLSEEEVIELHTAPRYPVYMLGFTPGFPFLGGLSEKLYTPRLDSPRTSVAAGSVGIANNQTGIYPIQSPGGWQLIGCTPLKLFDPDRKEPFLLKAGNFLQFKSISSDVFNQMVEEGQ